MRGPVLSRILFAASAAILVAAAAASCGPTQPLKCGPDTCSGCCTSDGKCLAKEKQGFQSCGAKGELCAACLPGELCEQGACVRDPDAGQVGGACDPSDCGGCCAGEVCLGFDDQTDQSCGTGGLSCGSCPANTRCQQGSCVSSGVPDGGSCGGKGQACCANDACYLGLTCVGGSCEVGGSGPDGGTQKDGGTAGTFPVGAACTVSSQCQSGQCRIAGFPGGYCTRSCTTNQDCPAGARCGADPSDTSGQTKLCLLGCTPAGSTTGCRSGYVCDQHGVSGGGGCVPGCVSPATCGAATQCDPRGFCCGADGYACCNGNTCDTGLTCGAGGYCEPPPTNQPIGAACTSDAVCASGSCVLEDSGGTSGCATGPCFPGGYCSADCASASCPAGSSCSSYLGSWCFQNCSQPGTTTGCRAGYVCDKNWIQGTSQAVCIDACNSNADCNSATLDCSGGFCCGKVSYRCCGGVGGTCPYGGTCGSDGYCQ